VMCTFKCTGKKVVSATKNLRTNSISTVYY